MSKTWYLSTPMNGKTDVEIKMALLRGIKWVTDRGEFLINPYKPEFAKFDESGAMVDEKPIAMLAKAIEPLDACTGILYIGSFSDLKKSRGCQSELIIAELYGKEVNRID